MGKTSNHYNAFSKWKENLLSGKKLSQQSSFPRRLQDAFYAGEGIGLILGRKIPMPSFETVQRLGLFKQHPIYMLLGEDKFSFYYKKNPNYLWDLFIFGSDITDALDYGLSIDIIEGFFNIDYQGRPQLKDILYGDKGRLGQLYEVINDMGVERFISIWSENEHVRGEIIGAIHSNSSIAYDEEEFLGRLDKLK